MSMRYVPATIQTALDSDIVMVLDECTPYPATHEYAEKSMEMSLRWAKRSHDEFQRLENPNSLFRQIYCNSLRIKKRKCF